MHQVGPTSVHQGLCPDFTHASAMGQHRPRTNALLFASQPKSRSSQKKKKSRTHAVINRSTSLPCRRTCAYQAAVSQLAVAVRSPYDLYAACTGGSEPAIGRQRRRTPQAAAPQPHLSSPRQRLPHVAISSSAGPDLCNSATCPRSSVLSIGWKEPQFW